MIKNLAPLRYFSHTIDPVFQPYSFYRTDSYDVYSKLTQTYKGAYSSDGMSKFKQRHPHTNMKPFMSNKNLQVSSIGLGTYHGSLDSSDDLIQFNSVIDTVLSGVNIIDTCNNFRGGKSQQVIGSALKFLIEQKQYKRNQLMIMSKAGYVRQKLPQELHKQLVNGHCVHPAYLQQCLNNSLDTLGLQKLDVFYLNNFGENQLEELGRDKFMKRLGDAFEFLQKMRREKKIQYYGLSSWECFRMSPESKKHLNLRHIVDLAAQVCGPNNGFKFTQVPINIMMPEIFAEKNQEFGSFLETAEALKMNVVSSSPLLSGTLINIPLPANKLSCRYNGAKHLQLIRSIPSPALVTTLIGHKRSRHLKKNLEAVNVPTLSEDEWFEIFLPTQEVSDKPT